MFSRNNNNTCERACKSIAVTSLYNFMMAMIKFVNDIVGIERERVKIYKYN